MDDWRSRARCYSMGTLLKTAKRCDVLTDVAFAVGPDENLQIFKAHRLIMACGSPVFQKILYGQSYVNFSGVIRLQYVNPLAFQYMIDCLYDEDPVFPDLTVASEVYKVAIRFEANRVKMLAERFLRHAITSKSVFFILEFAIENGLLNLKERCLKSMLPILYCILTSDNFATSSLETAKTILDKIRNKCSKIQYLSLMAIGNWKKRNKRYPENGVKYLLKCVNFDKVELWNFNDFISRYSNILTKSEALEITKYLLSPDRFKLPEWCTPDASYCGISDAPAVLRDSSDEDSELRNNFSVMDSSGLTKILVSPMNSIPGLFPPNI
ncbi:hypothetical protein TNIN_450561 [Trichonephila inaurata madagascariensis]|uniref:BTB domain-containing protein n=1 Tax=Trichonephila inaurata madagascariensis TaxID=2747483 RepID=A0A8X6MJ65_9ARAC|nr:hypothetical protein TNIN_450561 [Trichonephila inaurata madagascariensis]